LPGPNEADQAGLVWRKESERGNPDEAMREERMRMLQPQRYDRAVKLPAGSATTRELHLCQALMMATLGVLTRIRLLFAELNEKERENT
jgi:hypothetical protein